jgi:hypothetical protein
MNERPSVGGYIGAAAAAAALWMGGEGVALRFNIQTGAYDMYQNCLMQSVYGLKSTPLIEATCAGEAGLVPTPVLDTLGLSPK